MLFDARVDVTRAVIVQGITDAVAKADLVSPVGQPEGLREDALPSKPLQVVRFIQRQYPSVCVRCRREDQRGRESGALDGQATMMPKRRRTRAQHLARRIQAERKLNDDHVAERNKPPPF